MKVLVSFSDSDRALIDTLEEELRPADIELEYDRTLMNGTAVADDLGRRLQELDGWIVALGRQYHGSGWLDPEVVELLRQGDVVVPLHLPGHDENPVYSALADRSGIPLDDQTPDSAMLMIFNALVGIDSARRLDPTATLHDAGVRDRDAVRVSYQTTAGCFPAGALVLMADGSTTPISALESNDLVATSSRYQDRMVGAPVMRVVRYEDARCVTVNDQLTLTPSHSLFVNNEWMPAGEVRLGDVLRRADGTPITVTSMAVSNEGQPVYVPVLAPEHAGYFVEDIFVQNVVDDAVYEDFRRAEHVPAAIPAAMGHLVQAKHAAVRAGFTVSPAIRAGLTVSPPVWPRAPRPGWFIRR